MPNPFASCFTTQFLRLLVTQQIFWYTIWETLWVTPTDDDAISSISQSEHLHVSDILLSRKFYLHTWIVTGSCFRIVPWKMYNTQSMRMHMRVRGKYIIITESRKWAVNLNKLQMGLQVTTGQRVQGLNYFFYIWVQPSMINPLPISPGQWMDR